MNELTEELLRKVSLGYNWFPDMSYDQFVKKNKFHVSLEKSWEIWNMIEKRYIDIVFN